jgi:hypothetical protein
MSLPHLRPTIEAMLLGARLLDGADLRPPLTADEIMLLADVVQAALRLTSASATMLAWRRDTDSPPRKNNPSSLVAERQ